ncbi:YaaW family protein [Helicobacter pylori]|nr:YaaW family protein [Helicobacter pylori]
MQHYGANSFASALRGTGVLYREILCEVCNKLKVNYNKKSDTTLIEENMLSSILQKSLEKMSDEEIRELCDGLGVKNTNKLGKQALIAPVLTLFRMGGFKSLSIIALIVANAVIKAIFQRGLSLGANAALTRGLSILTGPVGWIITGVWTAIGIAGPAYRVTIPACILVTTLRLKLKA